MRIQLAGIFVNDQDKALAFYTEELGFKVKTDAPYSAAARWLTVVSPEDTDGVELLLGLPDETEAAFQQATREAGKPAISFATDNVRRDYERLKVNGVSFVMEPTKMPYGGTDALLEDGCGNLINLHQE
ncbi:MAG: VOC family protein [Actinobacteria bacterium]|nr:VOC family protein [Actinomycetota bacterium]